MLDLSATRSLNDEDIWVVGPLAVPFILKDLTLSKLNRFKELQYESFAVTSLKAIKKVNTTTIYSRVLNVFAW